MPPLLWRGFRYPQLQIAPCRSHQRSLIFYHYFWFPLNPHTADLYNNIGRCRVWRHCLTISRTGSTSKGFCAWWAWYWCQSCISSEAVYPMFMQFFSINWVSRHMYESCTITTARFLIIFFLELLRYIIIPKYKLNVELGNPPWKGKGGLELNFHIICQKRISGWLLVGEATNHEKNSSIWIVFCIHNIFSFKVAPDLLHNLNIPTTMYRLSTPARIWNLPGN